MLDILLLFFREFRLDFYRIVKNRPKPLSVLDWTQIPTSSKLGLRQMTMVLLLP